MSLFKDDVHAEVIEWLRKRPEELRPIMIRFPPGCQVVALKPLLCPRPGETGRVISYVEHEDEPPGVRIYVEGNPVAGECQPDWLEVVGYEQDITPDFVRAALSEKN